MSRGIRLGGSSSSPARPARSMRFWLLARRGAGRLKPMTVGLADGRRALCVFGFEEEAGMFLGLGGGAGCGWRARATGTGELVSILSGPCRGIGLVAMDPLPQGRAAPPNGLLCVDRGRFVDFLLGEGPGRDVATTSPTRGPRRGACPTSTSS